MDIVDYIIQHYMVQTGGFNGYFLYFLCAEL